MLAQHHKKMSLKDPENPMLNCSRIICLFEANAKIFSKIIWSQKLMTHILHHNIIPEQQHSACKGCDSTTALMYEKIILDIMHQQNGKIAVISNDAKGCYDRIIAILAGIICSKLGIPLGPILVIISFLFHQTHYV